MWKWISFVYKLCSLCALDLCSQQCYSEISLQAQSLTYDTKDERGVHTLATRTDVGSTQMKCSHSYRVHSPMHGKAALSGEDWVSWKKRLHAQIAPLHYFEVILHVYIFGS